MSPSKTWKDRAGREYGPDGYQFGDFSNSVLFWVENWLCMVDDGGQRRQSMEDEATRAAAAAEEERVLEEMTVARQGGAAPPREAAGAEAQVAEGAAPAPLVEDQLLEGGCGPQAILAVHCPTCGRAWPSSDVAPHGGLCDECKTPLAFGAVRAQDRPRMRLVPIDAEGKVCKSIRQAKLGSGSFGVVWRAMDKNDGQWYAVKDLWSQVRRKDQTDFQRFITRREAELTEAVIRDPHAFIMFYLEVKHSGSENQSIIMEFCQGCLFSKLCHSKERLGGARFTPFPQTRRWIGQIFLGLEHLHNLNLLHRDIKHENIVFAGEDWVKITDFGSGRNGVSRGQGDFTFKGGPPPGSPGFVAPEVLNQDKYDTRADYYAFAVLVWICLTGGMTDSPVADPPITRSQEKSWTKHRDDWRLFQAALRDPSANHALPLEGDEFDLVSQLTHRDPAERCQDLRSLAFMRNLGLPAASAGQVEMLQWARGLAPPAA